MIGVIAAQGGLQWIGLVCASGGYSKGYPGGNPYSGVFEVGPGGNQGVTSGTSTVTVNPSNTLSNVLSGVPTPAPSNKPSDRPPQVTAVIQRPAEPLRDEDEFIAREGQLVFSVPNLIDGLADLWLRARNIAWDQECRALLKKLSADLSTLREDHEYVRKNSPDSDDLPMAFGRALDLVETAIGYFSSRRRMKWAPHSLVQAAESIKDHIEVVHPDFVVKLRIKLDG